MPRKRVINVNLAVKPCIKEQVKLLHHFNLKVKQKPKTFVKSNKVRFTLPWLHVSFQDR